MLLALDDFCARLLRDYINDRIGRSRARLCNGVCRKWRYVAASVVIATREYPVICSNARRRGQR